MIYFVGVGATRFLSQQGHDDNICGQNRSIPCKTLNQLFFNYYNGGKGERRNVEKVLHIVTDTSISIEASITVSSFYLSISIIIMKKYAVFRQY